MDLHIQVLLSYWIFALHATALQLGVSQAVSACTIALPDSQSRSCGQHVS